jgi:multiple antibiotic resistance protein
MSGYFLSFNFTEVATAAMILFAVIDIVGGIPMIINIKQSAGRIYPVRATVVSMIIMIVFLFLGEKILKVVGIDIYSFAVAGSFVLFFLALEMILGIKLFKEETSIDQVSGSKVQSIVPLAFPIIAGAGTMTSILSLRAEFEALNILVAIIINMVIVLVVLLLTSKIEKLLGAVGINVLRKAFGIILLAIAVKLFSSNVKFLFA